MKIALIQLSTKASLDDNFATIQQYLGQAKSAEVDLVVLPEEFLTLSMSNREKLALAETRGQGPLQENCALLAREYGLNICAGTMPIKSPNPQKYFSTSILFDSSGKAIKYYDKIHLFDVKLAKDNESYFESEFVANGYQLQHCQLPGINGVHLGMSICYDIRFPLIYRQLAINGVNLFLLPSAFTIPTGRRHWEILVRARAIENLSFMVACNNVGTRKSGEGTYGHSMVISPWGEVIGQLMSEQDMLICDLNITEAEQLRKEFPVLSHSNAMNQLIY